MDSLRQYCNLFVMILGAAKEKRPEWFESRHKRSELSGRLEQALEASKWVARERRELIQCLELMNA